MTSNCTDSRVSAPTVDDIFDSTAIGNGYHQWAGPGGSIRVTADELRPALEAAYDPNMPDWPALLDWDDEAGSFHIA